MRLPEFAAESSLYRRRCHYQMTATAGHGSGIVPAAVNLCDVNCYMVCHDPQCLALCLTNQRYCPPPSPQGPLCYYQGRKHYGPCYDDCFNRCTANLNPEDPLYPYEVDCCDTECDCCCRGTSCVC